MTTTSTHRNQYPPQIRMTLLRAALLPSLLSLLAIACGGSTTNRPSTLQWHYDEVHIAQFSLQEKSSVLSAQNEYQRARAEQMKIEAQLRESETKLKIAKNEGRQAILAEESALEAKRGAESSGDMNRSNRAAKEQRVAELSRRAADDKITYLGVHRTFLKALIFYRQSETYHREARYEFQKAKLGQAHNIAPKGVKYERYQAQLEQRSRASQKAKMSSDSAMANANEAKKTWLGRLQEVKQAQGTGATSTATSTATTSSN